MNIRINPRQFSKILITLFLILSIGNIFSVFLQIKHHFSKSKSAVRLFNFDTEQNIPTLFSFLIILISGLLLLYISNSIKNNHKDFKTWRILGYTFILLAIDEAVSIHEIFGHILTTTFDLDGYFYFSWVIPYGIILIIFIVFIFKFLKELPLDTLKLFIISGVIYVLGAIGIEMIGSKIASNIGKSREFSLCYSMLYSIEESFEMIGIIIFIYALLKFISINNFKPLEISISK